jgi:hypothetical protein
LRRRALRAWHWPRSALVSLGSRAPFVGWPNGTKVLLARGVHAQPVRYGTGPGSLPVRACPVARPDSCPSSPISGLGRFVGSVRRAVH